MLYDESKIYNETINRLIKEDYEDFDQLVMENYFGDIIDSNELTLIKTDNFFDAGNDYIFFTYNNRIIFDIDDVESITKSQNKNDNIEMYMIQVKNTNKLDSLIPNKFIEFTSNLINKQTPLHYNEEVNSKIIFFNKLVENYLFEAKFYLHYYYFSRAGKSKLEGAKDLNGRFETLKKNNELIDFIEKTTINIESIHDIINTIKKDKTFKYTFSQIEKSEAEVDENGNTTALISLIPIKSFYDFILNKKTEQINDKLFDSNIRDFKGRSKVNKNITESLENKKNINFWWLNNGITITAENVDASKHAKRIELTNPQIVNGLQTSYSIFQYFSNNKPQLNNETRSVFVKILKVDPTEEEKELEIIVATNSQNEIRDKDIHANDDVQKKIELFLQSKKKYYQRKDKYYTNRKFPRKDIIKLPDMAKYINTIYLKAPSNTRNNPGKLLCNPKYDLIFQTSNIAQNYSRYYNAYKIYEIITQYNKGKILFGEDEFDKANFIHHIVYIVLCRYFNNIDYTPQDIESINYKVINENNVDDAIKDIKNTIKNNNIPHTKILKSIKEQSFKKMIDKYLMENFTN